MLFRHNTRVTPKRDLPHKNKLVKCAYIVVKGSMLINDERLHQNIFIFMKQYTLISYLQLSVLLEIAWIQRMHNRSVQISDLRINSSIAPRYMAWRNFFIHGSALTSAKGLPRVPAFKEAPWLLLRNKKVFTKWR